MNQLRKEIEDRFKRMVDAFAEDSIANDVYARSDLATETSSSFMDGIVMAAAVCGAEQDGQSKNEPSKRADDLAARFQEAAQRHFRRSRVS